tara:strand:- start:1275 stop:1535 length:261 start_codon:yes stop_codon:yes gene_type:complete
MKFIDIFKSYFDKKREEIVKNNPSEAVSTTVSANASKKVAATAAQNTTVSPDLSTMTVASLKGVAKDRGLKGYSKLRKADLIRLLS